MRCGDMDTVASKGFVRPQGVNLLLRDEEIKSDPCNFLYRVWVVVHPCGFRFSGKFIIGFCVVQTLPVLIVYFKLHFLDDFECFPFPSLKVTSSPLPRFGMLDKQRLTYQQHALTFIMPGCFATLLSTKFSTRSLRKAGTATSFWGLYSGGNQK